MTVWHSAFAKTLPQQLNYNTLGFFFPSQTRHNILDDLFCTSQHCWQVQYSRVKLFSGKKVENEMLDLKPGAETLRVPALETTDPGCELVQEHMEAVCTLVMS